MKLRCVVERITFQNPENGYSVLKTTVKGYADQVTVVGTLPDICAGTVLLCEGQWHTDRKYGYQFLVSGYEEVLPADIYGMEKYLGSGLIKGIGPVFARRIVTQFREETLEVIDRDSRRLSEVEGLGPKRIKTIRESWEKQKDIRQVMVFLQGHGVSPTFAVKIYKEYGKQSIEKVKENPYRLADDIWGIGFKTADSIASNLNFAHNSLLRCRSGLVYTLNRLADEGHVFERKDVLIQKAAELLQTETQPIEEALVSMTGEEKLIEENNCIYLPSMYFSEKGTANKLLRLKNSPPLKPVPPEAEINRILLSSGFQYEEIQREAIHCAATGKVTVLTGGPGTGKTTTVNGIITVLSAMKYKVALAAPTGRAAKRMTEATGMQAKTIHRLLEFKPPGGYGRNSDNPIDADALIVDECSMIDIVLVNALLNALPPQIKLILVGDTDQLPSVGAGNVLKDIIDSEVFPVIRLTKIFRQAQASRIITNAHLINKGQFPDLSNSRGTDFFFIEMEDPDAIASEIVELVKTRLPKFCNTSGREIQVLTPMQRGVTGTVNLNTVLQHTLNPSDEFLSGGGRQFRKNDKVMQIRNNYDKEVFNGDIGVITALNLQERELTVTFDDRPVTYEASELDELVLAYATTIHKAQGSEYPVAVIPLTMSHYVMLQRNLLYTGITRAKKLLVLIGTKKAVGCAVRNQTVAKRNSNLRIRLTNPPG